MVVCSVFSATGVVLVAVLGLHLTFAYPSKYKENVLDKRTSHLLNLIERKRMLDNSQKEEQELIIKIVEALKSRENLESWDSWEDGFDDEDVDVSDLDLESQFIFTGNGLEVKKVKSTENIKTNLNLERRPREEESSRRRAFGKEDATWPNGVIPYEIDNAFTTQEKDKIHKWASLLNKKLSGCMTLRPATSTDQYRVLFKGDKDGCWSYVGFRQEAKQVVNLERNDPSGGGCMHQNIFDHEVGHAIGLNHEQSRSDRDNYITINTANIDPGNMYNYDKENTMNLHPYDLASIMHYSKDSFVIDYSKDAFTVKDNQLEFLLDKGAAMMYYDVKDIVTRYKCTEKCTNAPNCKYGTFVDGNCKCRCPSGLKGTLCDEPVAHDTANCGDFLIDVSDGSTKTIQSKGYPGKMPVGYMCTWIIKGSDGVPVIAELNDISLAASTHCKQSLEVRYNRVGQNGPKFCGATHSTKTFISTKDETPELMMIILNVTDTTVSSDKFKITVSQKSGEPVVTKQTTKQPVTEQPTTMEPVTKQPPTQEPVVTKQTSKPPVTEQPTTMEPVTEPTPTQGPIQEYLKPCQSSSDCTADLQCVANKCACSDSYFFYWKESEQSCTDRSCLFEYNQEDNQCANFLKNKTMPTSWQHKVEDGNGYAYFKTVNGLTTSSLVSNSYPAGTYCLEFYLDISGGDTKSFNVETVTSAGTRNILFQKASTDGWMFFSSQISAAQQFSFELVASVNGQSGQIFLDDVFFNQGNCAQW